MPPAPIWHIQLLGILQLIIGETIITKFRTQATGLLLARLALRKGRPLPREILINEIFSDMDAKRGRQQLSVALSALRKISPDVPLIVADNFHVALDPQFLETDVALFEAALKNARRATEVSERLRFLEQAADLHTDELLVGQYNEWVLPERQRLKTLFDEAALERKRLQATPVRAVKAVPARVQESQASPLSFPASPVEGLPPTFTRFFGRDDDVAELVHRFTEPTEISPLITLIGTGGIGKTRLALEVAKQARPTYDGRVYFVALAEVTSGSMQYLWDVIRDALPLGKEPAADPLEQIATFLSHAPSLLILDNLEQLTGSGEAAEMLTALRTRIPSLACLVTTRNVIGVVGEQLYTLGSLLKTGSGIAVEAQPAVQLFIDRARIVYHAFPTTKINLNDVLHLCHLLEGIPLAIELAAARANVLTPAHLLTQLKSSFAFLRSRRRDVPERHRSLYAAADSSYRLLSPELQTVFHRLSVFRGGWTLEAVDAICTAGLDELTGVELLDALTELHECSLISSAIGSDPQPRFRMLETLREFASYTLRQVEGEEENQIKQRHRVFFAELAGRAEAHLSTGSTEQSDWLDKLEADQDNLFAALNVPALAEDALDMGTHLHRFWFLRGHTQEGIRRLTGLLDAAQDSPSGKRAKGYNALGVLSWGVGDLIGAQNHFSQALELYRAEGDTNTLAKVLNNIGIVASQNGNFDLARDSYTQSLALYRAANDTLRQSVVLTNLGGVLIYQKDFPAAREALEDALRIQRAAKDNFSVLQTLHSVADVAIRQSDVVGATSALSESLMLRRTTGDRNTIWEPLTTAAAILSAKTKNAEAAVTWYAAQALKVQAEAEKDTVPANTEDEKEIVKRLQDSLPPRAMIEAEEKGRTMNFIEAVDFAHQALLTHA